MRLVVAILVTSSLASAEPRHEYAVRLGASWFSTKGNYGADPKGRAPALDGEITLRWSYVSLSLFGSYFTLRDSTDYDDQDVRIDRDARYHFVDAGARITIHGRGAGPFWGVGLADEMVIESGTATQCYCDNNYCNPCSPDYSNRPYTRWNHAPLLEAHLGVTPPKIRGVALDLLVMFGWSANPDNDDGNLTTTRVSLGGRF